MNASITLASVLAHLSAQIEQEYADCLGGHAWVNEHRANLALDLFCSAVDERYHFSADAIRQVYEAAKLVFAEHPGKRFTYDLPGALCGSPWEQTGIETPEQWVICYARRSLEDADGCITEEFDAHELIPNGSTVMLNLAAAGVPVAAIEQHLSMLCYGNEIAANMLLQCSPFPKAA